MLRDHFREIAEQTTRSLTESIQSTEKAANKEVSERESRAKMIEQQLKFLGEVHPGRGSVMNAFDRVRAMLAEAGQVYRNDPHSVVPVPRTRLIGAPPASKSRCDCARGTLKAGKSTLLNALVGEELAPTDATECTRIVTWFHHGAILRQSGRGT